jgi:hypothetical protein
MLSCTEVRGSHVAASFGPRDLKTDFKFTRSTPTGRLTTDAPARRIPRSGRTPERDAPNPFVVGALQASQVLGPDRNPLGTVGGRWIPWPVAKVWQRIRASDHAARLCRHGGAAHHSPTTAAVHEAAVRPGRRRSPNRHHSPRAARRERLASTCTSPQPPPLAARRHARHPAVCRQRPLACNEAG